MEIYSNFLYLFFICRAVSGCLDHAHPHFPCSEAVRCGGEMPHTSACLMEIGDQRANIEVLGEGPRKSPERGFAQLVSDPPSSLLSFLPTRKVGMMAGTPATIL